MSILFADDFNGYGSNTAYMTDGLYGVVQQTSLSQDPDPNVATGRYALQMVANALNGLRFRRVFPASRGVVGAAFRVWLSGLPFTDAIRPSFGCLDASSIFQFTINFDTIGRIVVRDLNQNLLAVTSGPVVTSNAWNHIEMKATSASGNIEIRVNGITVLSATALALGGPYYQFGSSSPTGYGGFYGFYIKDLVVWDSLGGVNSDFLGSVQVIGLTPSADVSFPWAAATGSTGFNMIDNSPPLDGTEYITAIYPPPAAASFELSALPSNITSVKALITQIRARKADGGDGSIQAGLISGASTTLGQNRPVTTAFTFYEDVVETDPATSTSWTPVSADAARVQVNRTV